MYLVGLHIYYKMIHGPYNVKSIVVSFPKKLNSVCGGFLILTFGEYKRLGTPEGDLTLEVETRRQ